MEEIKSVPFSWDDNFSEDAIETMKNLKSDIGYCAYQDVMMALAKLKILEEQGCKVGERHEMEVVF